MKRLDDRTVLTLGGAAMAVLFVLDFFDHEHFHQWWHAMPGFDIVYGLIGCAVIVYGSKWLGKLFLQRREDYYDG